MNITHTHSLTPSPYAQLSTPAAAPQAPIDARAKGDEMALLDNFVRTPLFSSGGLGSDEALQQAGKNLKNFVLGAAPAVGTVKHMFDTFENGVFGNGRKVGLKRTGTLLNASGTAALIHGISTGSGLSLLGSAILLAGSGVTSTL